jgi:hypothetical protein
MQNLASRLVRFVLKLVLLAFGLVFAISLLLAALLVIGVSLLKSLVTGKKPAPVMVFRRFQQFAPGGMWPGASKAQKTNDAVDVVDVEVREVKADPAEPTKGHLPL